MKTLTEAKSDYIIRFLRYIYNFLDHDCVGALKKRLAQSVYFWYSALSEAHYPAIFRLTCPEYEISILYCKTSGARKHLPKNLVRAICLKNSSPGFLMKFLTKFSEVHFPEIFWHARPEYDIGARKPTPGDLVRETWLKTASPWFLLKYLMKTCNTHNNHFSSR